MRVMLSFDYLARMPESASGYGEDAFSMRTSLSVVCIMIDPEKRAGKRVFVDSRRCGHCDAGLRCPLIICETNSWWPSSGKFCGRGGLYARGTPLRLVIVHMFLPSPFQVMTLKVVVSGGLITKARHTGGPWRGAICKIHLSMISGGKGLFGVIGCFECRLLRPGPRQVHPRVVVRRSRGWTGDYAV